MDNKKKLVTWLFRLAIIALIVYFYQRNKQAQSLFETSVVQLYEVVDKQCKESRGGSFINVRHKGEIYRVEYYGKKCFDVNIGESVQLYFDPKNNSFLVPESTIYERYVYGGIILLLMSFIPWSKISKK